MMERGQAYCEAGTNRIANRKLLGDRLQNDSQCRPARIDNPGTDFWHFSWRGYYSGEYMMQDYSGAMQFNRQNKILSDQSLKNFAALPWRMLSISEDAQAKITDFQSAVPVNVNCVSYGTTRIHHRVNISSGSLVVENELYWLGWDAELINGNNMPVVIQAIDVKGFRGWNLPAGKYDMIEKYTTPYKTLSLAVTFFGLLIWLGVLYILWKHRMPFNLRETCDDSKSH
jgi:hypothetical protein